MAFARASKYSTQTSTQGFDGDTGEEVRDLPQFSISINRVHRRQMSATFPTPEKCNAALPPPAGLHLFTKNPVADGCESVRVAVQGTPEERRVAY